MSRETIEFTEEQLEYSLGDITPEGFEFIDEYSTSFDGEKGFTTYEVIIQRLSDKKFFKGEFYRGQDIFWDDYTFEETFPKQTITTIYE